MENNDSKSINYDFLLSDYSQQVFSKLDYALKDGVHLQRNGSDPELYTYLERYEHELKPYYQKLFGVRLEKKGEGDEQYFFLHYHSVERSGIPEIHKHNLKNEHIIIGLIIYKIIFFDGNIELNSIKKLKQKITLDYEEYEQGLVKLIAKSSDSARVNEDDIQIDKEVEGALRQFEKLGWLYRKQDHFELLASFQRLLYVYEDVIKNIDEIIARYQ